MKVIIKIFEFLFRQLRPPQPFSWQTLILLSFFSYLMAVIAITLPQPAIFAYNVITHWGLVFLTLGVIFIQIERPWIVMGFDIGPWVIGLLLCILLFKGWPERWLYLTSVTWPVMSGVVATLPKFFLPGLYPYLPPPPVRQKAVILIFSHILLSCWVQFYFLIQDWLEQYPTLLADDFSRSALVLKLGTQSPNPDRAIAIIESMEAFLRTKIDAQPWERVDEWLSQFNSANFEEEVRAILPEVEENNLWELNAVITRSGLGYKVVLFAIWKGPSANPEGYYRKKSCEVKLNKGRKISRVSPLPTLQPKPPKSLSKSKLECGRVGNRVPGQPK